MWESCFDWFSATFHKRSGKETREDPKGPPTSATRVMNGGSYLCHRSYCNRCRVVARSSNTPDSRSDHIGFRWVADV